MARLKEQRDELAERRRARGELRWQAASLAHVYGPMARLWAKADGETDAFLVGVCNAYRSYVVAGNPKREDEEDA